MPHERQGTYDAHRRVAVPSMKIEGIATKLKINIKHVEKYGK